MKTNIRTRQMQEWAGEFGIEYTNRNSMSLQETDLMYKELYGFTRSEINSMFLDNLDRGMKILEVGSNIGTQLLYLQQAGFKNLYGIELQPYAVELSKHSTKNINLIQGSAFDIPFKDGFFDFVFTSTLLIHISPKDIGLVLSEIYRCTKKYIWCFEYYADTYTEVEYRGHKDLLWKTDFAKLFFNQFHDLGFVQEKHFKYLGNDNVDTMFMLKKGD